VALLKAVEEEIAFGVEGEGLEGNVGDAGLGADPGVRFMGNDLEYVVIGQIAWAGKEIRRSRSARGPGVRLWRSAFLWSGLRGWID
jgi:hypothetical protein